jgi:hypothetical protein
LMCVLHCLWDKEDPWGVVGQFRDAVAPGSYLALRAPGNRWVI